MKNLIRRILKEEISSKEALNDADAIKTVIDNKRNLGFITVKTSTFPEEKFWQIVKKFDLGILEVPSNPYGAFIYFKKGHENEAKELKDIAEKYKGYLSYKATDEETRRIGELLGYRKKDIDKFIEKNSSQKPTGLS